MNLEIRCDYWAVRGESPEKAIEKLREYDKDDLVALVFNNRLNDFISKYSDYKDGENEERGKRVPYIGWYWRSTDWFNKIISIGDCGEFIGVMENNKWNHPERLLTKEEADKVLDIVWQAKVESEKGGDMAEINRKTKSKLEELWDLFQTFKI